MNKSPGPSQASNPEENPSGHLDFPVAPDFASLPPRLDPQSMLHRIEKTMPWRSTRPGERQKRTAAIVQVEFVL